MRRATGALLSLALVLVGATAAMSQSGTPDGYNVVARSELADGVEYLKLTRGGPAEVAHVAHLAPGAPVDLRVVNAGDRLSAGPSDLETTSSMCRREHCVVGVNGDFHINGVPAGAVVAGGRMLHSPDPGRPQLTVTADGRLVAGPLPWTGSFTFADGTTLPVATVNAAPPAGGLALFTPAYGGATAASGRTELVVRSVRGAVAALNQPADVELRAVRSGDGPIPSDGAVLSADGAAAQQLLEAWGRRPNGAGSHARLAVASPVNAEESLGAYPVVLRNGKRALPWNDPNLVYPRQPHTLVGWNDDGDVYLVAVDGRQTAAEGLTMAEAADFLVGLGVTDAVNLDGGGGTTFVANGSVLNRPSDNDPARPAQYTERGAANAFVVLARPQPAPPPPASSVHALEAKPSPSPSPAGAAPGDPADPGPSATAPTGPDGSAGADAAPAAATDAAAADPAVDPRPGDPTLSAASSPPSPGAPRLKSVPPSTTGAASAAAPPAPAGGVAGELHSATEVLRAPLAAATSLTGDVVDAVLGERHEIPGGSTRRTGAALAATLSLTAIAVRRRRTGDHPALPEPAGFPLADPTPAREAELVYLAEPEPEPEPTEPAEPELDLVTPVEPEPESTVVAEPELELVAPVEAELEPEPTVPVEPELELVAPVEAEPEPESTLVAELEPAPERAVEFFREVASDCELFIASVPARPSAPEFFREVPSECELVLAGAGRRMVVAAALSRNSYG